jgi:hypothetical protein
MDVLVLVLGVGLVLSLLLEPGDIELDDDEDFE